MPRSSRPAPAAPAAFAAPPASASPLRPAAKPRGGPAPSLGEQAYVAIKRMILTRALQPGDQINVAQLSEQLSLGRSPVHLAIHRLAREGLVSVLPRKGILVKAETLDSFLALVEARLLVEPYLTGLAIDRSTSEWLRRLEDILALAWQRHEHKDRDGDMEMDRLFHQTLYAQSGNAVLVEFAGQLLDRSMRLWLQPASPRETRPNVAELQDLFDAIRQGDKALAISHMQAHIGSVRQKVLP